jgi:8-oxo-dGTP diphosphatase
MTIPQTPLVAADIIIELIDRPERPIIFVERRNPPLGWALPGGFVDIGESVEQAAVREAMEETGLNVRLKVLLGCYSRPDRDPRRHTVSLVYVAEATGEPLAQDDAMSILIRDPLAPPSPLVFDHPLILEDYCRYRVQGGLTPIR